MKLLITLTILLSTSQVYADRECSAVCTGYSNGFSEVYKIKRVTAKTAEEAETILTANCRKKIVD